MQHYILFKKHKNYQSNILKKEFVFITHVKYLAMSVMYVNAMPVLGMTGN